MIFESHPGKKLINHIDEVRKIANKFLNDKEDSINKTLDIACKCHDFGKYTTYFQKHLYKKYNGNLSNHGFISALFGAFVGLKIFGEDSYLPLILYSVILHHHGNLENADEDLPTELRFNLSSLKAELKFKLDIVNSQLDDMKNNYAEIVKDLSIVELEEYFDEFIEKRPYEYTLRSILKVQRLIEMSRMDKQKMYTTHQLLYSCLIDADKMSASNTPIPEVKEMSYSILYNKYLDQFKEKSGKIDKIRSEVFNRVQKNLQEVYKSNKYFSITAPTGTGKTLAGFYAAKRLRELLGGNRKIIYALPFTSIIDQNYSVIFDLHEDNEDFQSCVNQYIVKHHHLSDVDYKSDEIDYGTDSSLLLMESWQSSIVVTTFVQLFETIIGYRNRMLKKFHSIKGSIIILDELQTLDIKYWKLIDYMLKKICDDLDCRIITMTATRPIILKDAFELLDNYQEYFSSLNRVTLTFDSDKVTVDEFCENFINQLQYKSYLIICNTIGQSLGVYNRLKDLDRKVMYLSTNIVPRKRRERIERIKEIMDLKPIVISTQVVEAGVDLDFDIVYRDLAPMDSIIQAAGRCNRNGTSQGEVRVVKMVNDDRLYGSFIYGKMLLILSEEILSKGYFKESEFLNIIEKYFMLAIEKMNSVDESKKIIKAIENIQFSEVSDFSIIKNRPDYIDVYFEIDDKAKELFEKYKKDVLEEKDSKKRYENLLKLKPELRSYMISLPVKFKNQFIEQKSIFRMPIEDKCRLYEDDIGFNKDDIDDTIIL